MKNVVLPYAGERDLRFYLAMEEYVARCFDDELFFVWQSEPTVIIGRNQDLEAEVNIDFCTRMGIKVVRRKSGGGCVYSDEGNIMISYISRRADAEAVFGRYLSSLSECLSSMGISSVRSERNDILVNGLKVSGNAIQMRTDRTIAHGTLLYSTDLNTLEQAIKPPIEKLTRHGVGSVRQRVANLSDYLPVGWNVEKVKNFLVNHFTNGTIRLSETDIDNIKTLITQNYGG